MTSEQITQLRIRATASLKAKGVAYPMPDQTILEMKRLSDEGSFAASMFNDLFGNTGLGGLASDLGIGKGMGL